MISSCVVLPRQFAGDAALPHHQDAVGHLQQFRHLGTHHQDRRAGARQLVHHLEDFHLRADIDAARRLIEQEYTRAARQPLRDHDLLLIAAAQPSGQLLRARALDAQPADVFAA